MCILSRLALKQSGLFVMMIVPLHNVYCSVFTYSCLQIEQDFSLMFGDATSAKFLEKWPSVYKQKVLEQSHGLTQTADLQDLVQNAESTTEVENGMLE